MLWRLLSSVVVVGFAGSVLFAAPKDDSPARKADEQAIRAAAKAYVAAIERGDAKAALSFWVPGGDIIDAQRRSRPASELIAQATDAAKGPRPTIKLDQTSIRFLTPESAIEDGTSEVTRDPNASPVRGAFSAAWVKQGGKWKLASVRESRVESPPPAPAGSHLQQLEWMVGKWKAEDDGKVLPKNINFRIQ